MSADLARDFLENYYVLSTKSDDVYSVALYQKELFTQISISKTFTRLGEIGISSDEKVLAYNFWAGYQIKTVIINTDIVNNSEYLVLHEVSNPEFWIEILLKYFKCNVSNLEYRPLETEVEHNDTIYVVMSELEYYDFPESYKIFEKI